ncbi:MAG: GYF domain-containing protein [Pseudomonadota bacterium]
MWWRCLVVVIGVALFSAAPARASDYHISVGGQAAGPFPLEALYAKVRDGVLTPTTLAWTTGQGDWRPAGEIAALELLFVRPPPMPAASPAVQLPAFYVDLGSAEGPFDGEQLLALVREGRLTPETKVWREGMADWAPAGSVSDLATLFEGSSGPPPLPDDRTGPPPIPADNDGPPRSEEAVETSLFPPPPPPPEDGPSSSEDTATSDPETPSLFPTRPAEGAFSAPRPFGNSGMTALTGTEGSERRSFNQSLSSPFPETPEPPAPSGSEQ